MKCLVFLSILLLVNYAYSNENDNEDPSDNTRKRMEALTVQFIKNDSNERKKDTGNQNLFAPFPVRHGKKITKKQNPPISLNNLIYRNPFEQQFNSYTLRQKNSLEDITNPNEDEIYPAARVSRLNNHPIERIDDIPTYTRQKAILPKNNDLSRKFHSLDYLGDDELYLPTLENRLFFPVSNINSPYNPISATVLLKESMAFKNNHDNFDDDKNLKKKDAYLAGFPIREDISIPDADFYKAVLENSLSKLASIRSGDSKPLNKQPRLTSEYQRSNNGTSQQNDTVLNKNIRIGRKARRDKAPEKRWNLIPTNQMELTQEMMDLPKQRKSHVLRVPKKLSSMKKRSAKVKLGRNSKLLSYPPLVRKLLADTYLNTIPNIIQLEKAAPSDGLERNLKTLNKNTVRANMGSYEEGLLDVVIAQFGKQLNKFMDVYNKFKPKSEVQDNSNSYVKRLKDSLIRNYLEKHLKSIYRKEGPAHSNFDIQTSGPLQKLIKKQLKALSEKMEQANLNSQFEKKRYYYNDNDNYYDDRKETVPSIKSLVNRLKSLKKKRKLVDPNFDLASLLVNKYKNFIGLAKEQSSASMDNYPKDTHTEYDDSQQDLTRLASRISSKEKENQLKSLSDEDYNNSDYTRVLDGKRSIYELTSEELDAALNGSPELADMSKPLKKLDSTSPMDILRRQTNLKQYVEALLKRKLGINNSNKNLQSSVSKNSRKAVIQHLASLFRNSDNSYSRVKNNIEPRWSSHPVRILSGRKRPKNKETKNFNQSIR